MIICLQDFLEGVSPLISLRLAGVALEGLSIRFHRYIDMLIEAVPDPKGNGRVSSTNEIGRTTTPRSARSKVLLIHSCWQIYQVSTFQMVTRMEQEVTLHSACILLLLNCSIWVSISILLFMSSLIRPLMCKEAT